MSALKEMKRLRLQTLARALTEKDKLLVRLGESSSTDLADLELKDPDLEIVPGVPCSPAEKWVAAKATCAHESAHVLFTDRRVWVEACRSGLFLQHVFNVLEDARVERAMANAYPGTLGWFRFANEYIYRNRNWGEGAQAFLFGLCSYAVVGKIPAAIPPEIRELIERCKPLVDRARVAESTREALDCAREIHTLVKDAFPSPSLPPLPAVGTDSPRRAPAGPLDPRPVPGRKRGPAPEERGENEPGGRDSQNPPDRPNGVPEAADAKPGGEPGETPGGEPEGEPERDGTPEAAGDGPDAGEPGGEPGEPEDEPDDLDGDQPEKELEGDADDEPEDDPEPGDDRSNGGPGEEADDDGPDNGSDEPEDEFDPGNEEEDDRSAGDDAGDELGDNPESGDGPDDKPDEDAGWPDDDGPDDEPGGDDEEEDWPDGKNGDRDEDSDADWPNEGVPDENDGPDGAEVAGNPGEYGDDADDLTAVLEEASREIAAMENSAARQEKDAARNKTPQPEWDEVRDEVAVGIHTGCRFEWRDLPPAPQNYHKLVQAQQGLVRRLVEEIRKTLEFKATVARRNLKKGRLDAGSLWKLRVPDPQVFSRRETPGDVPTVAILLLVDCSGSMSDPQLVNGRYSRKPKIEMAREAAAVLHEACAALGVPHAVTGFGSSYPETWFFRAVMWGERDGDRIGSLTWRDVCNRDGFAIRVVSKELELRPEPRKVLVVLSDGLPNDRSNYSIAVSSRPVNDTARAVRELEKKGIGVVGLFFGDEDHAPTARQIYNRFVYVQDVGHLPVVLGKVLKEVIAGGA